MRINITIDDHDDHDDHHDEHDEKAEGGEREAAAPADLAARAAAIGASSGGPAPTRAPEHRGEPPPFVPEEPGGTSAPPVEPMAISNSTAVSSAGPAPFGPEPEPPVEIDEDGD